MISKLKGYIAIVIAFLVFLYTIFKRGEVSGKDKQEMKQLLKTNEKQKDIDNAPKINTSDELRDKLRKGTF